MICKKKISLKEKSHTHLKSRSDEKLNVARRKCRTSHVKFWVTLNERDIFCARQFLRLRYQLRSTNLLDYINSNFIESAITRCSTKRCIAKNCSAKGVLQ